MAETDDQPQSEGAPAGPYLPPIPVVYFNSSFGYATEYEISMDLGFHTAGLEPEIAVRAVTTWEHAKNFRDMLDRMIARYESSVAPIREFPDDQGNDPDNPNGG